MSGIITIFYGAVVTPIDTRSWRAMPSCLFAVGSTGNIDWMFEHIEELELEGALTQKGHKMIEVVMLKEGEFIIPGLVDTHTHAPQYPNLGRGGQYELLDWLNEVTFPKEIQFEDEEFAQDAYAEVVRRSLDCGTTTSCYYSTIHVAATKILAKAACQRAFIGKCNMDRCSENPPRYNEKDAETSIAHTEEVISYIRSLPPVTSHAGIGTTPEPLIQPILTPRFAISCTGEVLHGLSALADKYNSQHPNEPRMRIQTHISENKAEVAYTLELYGAKTYAGVYDSHGLLRDTTILAHAVHLMDEEIKMIKERNVGISHCPTSNFNLRSGVAPVGRFLDEGIKVGLGTDVSGGYAISMLSAIRNASIASKVIAMNTPPPVCEISQPQTSLGPEGEGDPRASSSPPQTSAAESDSKVVHHRFAGRHLPIQTLFYLATLGGANVCGLTKRVGSFSPGKSFDALVVSVLDETGAIGVWGKEAVSDDKKKEKLEENLERFLFCGDDRNILRVYVQGRLVGGKSFRG